MHAVRERFGEPPERTIAAVKVWRAPEGIALMNDSVNARGTWRRVGTPVAKQTPQLGTLCFLRSVLRVTKSEQRSLLVTDVTDMMVVLGEHEHEIPIRTAKNELRGRRNVMSGEEQLNYLLRFRPHPGPTPDPASLLQFFVEIEQPAARQAALAAYLQLSVDTFQSQVRFVQGLQKAMGQKVG